MSSTVDKEMMLELKLSRIEVVEPAENMKELKNLEIQKLKPVRDGLHKPEGTCQIGVEFIDNKLKEDSFSKEVRGCDKSAHDQYDVEKVLKTVASEKKDPALSSLRMKEYDKKWIATALSGLCEEDSNKMTEEDQTSPKETFEEHKPDSHTKDICKGTLGLREKTYLKKVKEEQNMKIKTCYEAEKEIKTEKPSVSYVLDMLELNGKTEGNGRKCEKESKENLEKGEKDRDTQEIPDEDKWVLDGMSDKLDANDDEFFREEMPEPIAVTQISSMEELYDKAVLNCFAQEARTNQVCFQNNIFSDSFNDKCQDMFEANSFQGIGAIEHDNENLLQRFESFKCESKIILMSSFESASFNGPSEDNSSDDNDVSIEVTRSSNCTDQTYFAELAQDGKMTCLEEDIPSEMFMEQKIQLSNKDEIAISIDWPHMLYRDLKEVADKVPFKTKALSNKQRLAKKRSMNKVANTRQKKLVVEKFLKINTKGHVISKPNPFCCWHDTPKYRDCSGGQNGHKQGGKGGPRSANSGTSNGSRGSLSSWSGGAQRSQGNQSGDDGDDPDDQNRRNKNLKAYPSCDQDNPDEGRPPRENEERKLGKGSHNTFGKMGHGDDTLDQSTSDVANVPPNLPSVCWDERTLLMRRVRENVLTNNPSSQQTINTSPGAAVGGPNSDRAGMLPGTIPLSSAPTEDVDANHNHAIISPTQLCEIIGHAALNNEVPAELFSKFDTCLQKAMHDLSYTQYDCHDNFESDGASNPQSATVHATANMKTCASTVGNGQCTVCLIISGLLTHMTQESHNSNCPMCVQVLALMTQHTKSCVINRPHQRFTRFDLCYKICKKAGWNVEGINCGWNTFSGKIHKYCGKVLGNDWKTPGKETEASETVAVGIGEMDMLASPGALSSSRGTNSSITYLTSSGPITHESQDPNNYAVSSSTFQHSDKEVFQFKFSDVKSTSIDVDLPVQNKPSLPTLGTENSQVSHGLPANLNSTSCGVLSQEAAVAVPTIPGPGRKAHSNLVRKSSQRTPAIPQPIVEESPPVQRAQVSKDDTSLYQLMKKRYLQGPKGTDPYDTQPTFGDKKGYDSLPQGLLHDQEQFISFGNRPVGVPGIGEVVCGNPRQLRLVARFWERKREDCERTGTIPPYQHREEGVLLSHSKEHFSILRTRYQKHQQWEKVAHLGNGMSGKCHLVMDLKTNFKFCCKKVHLLQFSEQEVSLWSEIKHPFIVKLYGAIRHGVKILIFSEFIDGGSLAVCIEEQKRLGQRFSHWSAINYFQQLLKVLSYLQSKNILHEDIKADNILLRKDSSYIAVTDFGLSLRLCDPRELRGFEPRGSAAHWSPEKVTSQGHGFPSDLWAAVCVLIHMLSGDPPWMRRFAQTATTLLYIIYSKEPPLQDVPTSVQPIVRDLIASGLVKDPEKRPSPSQLLQHEAFKILDDVKPEVFFSVLVTHSQSIRPLSNDAQKKSEESNNKEGERCQVLYSADVSTVSDQGTCVLSSEVCLPVREIEDGEVEEVEKVSNAKFQTDIVANRTSLTNTELQLPPSQSSFASENNGSRLASGAVASNPHQLQQNSAQERRMSSQNQQIPDFSELLSGLVPHESKAFYNDDVPNGAEALWQSSAKQKNSLAFYRPQKESYQVPNSTSQSDSNHVPNLSIFETSISVDRRNENIQNAIADTSTLASRLFTTQAQDTSLQAVGRGMEASLRPSLSYNRQQDYSLIASMLSSSSDDYPSSELVKDFCSPPVKESDRSDGIENPLLASTPVYPQNIQQRQPSSLYEHQISPSYDQNGAVSLGSSLQQRKPNNLKLNVSSSPDRSSPSNTSSRVGNSNSKRVSGSQFDSPSTGQLSSNSSRMGSSRSVSSPWFEAGSAGVRNGIYHEQERLFRMYTAEQESHSSSGSERIDYNIYQEPRETLEVAHRNDGISDSEALSLLQENIVATPLAGYKLLIRDAASGREVMFMRSMDQPITKKHLIQELKRSKKIKYRHFVFCNMDGSLLRLGATVDVQEILVKEVEQPQKGCLCETCLGRF